MPIFGSIGPSDVECNIDYNAHTRFDVQSDQTKTNERAKRIKLLCTISRPEYQDILDI